MEAAPLFTEVADAPPNGKAVWRQADDGMRLRIGWWSPVPASAPKGTVFLFPGRTEYIEKYGSAARVFTAGGYGLITIDWRGQGLTERAFPDRRLGH
ncbi:MAG TPA: alpha/beta hydrolase, partial [Rhodobacterales bacterium]|nr:alpha/beta hydrolase [Rhodobacterales bacterium]